MGCGASAVADAATPSIAPSKVQSNISSRGSWKRASLAVSLSFLLRFGSQIPRDLTTAEVVQKYIIPATAKNKGRYVETMASKDVGAPTYFVSHSWGQPFHDVVDNLKLHLLGGQNPDINTQAAAVAANTYLWLDIFAVNQHGISHNADILGDLRNVVATSAATLFCSDPHGVCLTRSWCLYELYATITMGTANKLQVVAYSVDLDSMKDAYNALSIETSHATLESDREAILAEIGEGISCMKAKDLILSALVVACALEAEAAAEAIVADPSQAAQAVQSMRKHATMLAVAGNFKKAKAVVQEAVRLVQEQLGDEHPAVAALTYDMGQLLAAQGQHNAAREAFMKALTLQRQALGPSAEDTLATLASLGLTLKAAGRLDEAEAIQRHLVDMLNERGSGETRLPAALNNLALTLMERGQFAEAEAPLKEALTLAHWALGREHAVTASMELNLAAVLCKLNRPAEATPLAKHAADSRAKLFGEVHPDTNKARNAWAKTLEEQGKMDEVEEIYLQVLKASEAAPKHPDTVELATTLAALGMLYQQHGYGVRAFKLLKHALDIRTSLLGKHHPDTAAAMTGLAGALMAAGKRKEAEVLYRQVLAVRKKVAGGDDLTATQAENNLAALLYKQGNIDEAEQLWRQAMGTRTRLLGPDHPDTATLANNLGALLASQGRIDEAIEMYQQVLAVRRVAFGAQHKLTLAVQAKLAGLKAGRFVPPPPAPPPEPEPEAADAAEIADAIQEVQGWQHSVTPKPVHIQQGDEEESTPEAVGQQTVDGEEHPTARLPIPDMPLLADQPHAEEQQAGPAPAENLMESSPPGSPLAGETEGIQHWSNDNDLKQWPTQERPATATYPAVSGRFEPPDTEPVEAPLVVESYSSESARAHAGSNWSTVASRATTANARIATADYARGSSAFGGTFNGALNGTFNGTFNGRTSMAGAETTKPHEEDDAGAQIWHNERTPSDIRIESQTAKMLLPTTSTMDGATLNSSLLHSESLARPATGSTGGVPLWRTMRRGGTSQGVLTAMQEEIAAARRQMETEDAAE